MLRVLAAVEGCCCCCCCCCLGSTDAEGRACGLAWLLSEPGSGANASPPLCFWEDGAAR